MDQTLSTPQVTALSDIVATLAFIFLADLILAVNIRFDNDAIAY